MICSGIEVKAGALKRLLFFQLLFFQVFHSPFHAETVFEEIYSPLCLSKNYPYKHNSHVSEEVWERLKPYFLPIHHPIKKRLDKIFKKHRVILSQEAFEKAGFQAKIRKADNIVVGRHPECPKYLFKVYFDTHLFSEWEHLLKRIEGALAIQECIKDHHFTHFCIPKKWIYPLPEEPPPPEKSGYYRKNFILVVEEMDLLSKKENLDAFKNEITPEMLTELYLIISQEGLIDSIYPDNIPFTKKGKLAFIDTEHRYPGALVKFKVLGRYLSSDNKKIWKSLYKSHSPAQRL